MDEIKYHIPVLLNEAIDGLKIEKGGVYIDATFGGGGHSKEILKRIGEKGKLIAFDKDIEAHANKINDSRLTLIHAGFGQLEEELKNHKIKMINGLLADLGVSSHQFDMAARGFSFRFNSDLDMRMDNRQHVTAADILSTYSEKHLQTVFSSFGEIKNSRSLANTLCLYRKQKKLNSIVDLKNAIAKCVDKKDEKGYYAQIFQALRIEVNGELNELQLMLLQCGRIMQPGGRLAVISYHSLEDRLVKNYISTGTFNKTAETDLFGNKTSKNFRAINKKLIEPSTDEIKSNPRARSAKLRVAEKL